MTATVAPSQSRLARLGGRVGWPRRRPSVPRSGPAAAPGVGVPPLSPTLQLVRGVLVCVLVLSGSMLLHLAIVSRLQHSAAQERNFDTFREQLALGTAPIGPTDSDGAELEMGTPVAKLQIPWLGVNEVVFEGTTSSVLLDGPGHRRDTPLPGQAGTSVLFGRRGAYGGPFARIGELRVGDEISVTTGQGQFEYSVIGVRREGDPTPPAPAAGTSRLVLTTADGSRFLPNGVLRVDADIVDTAVVGPGRLIRPANLPTNERAMEGDSSTMWVLALWLQALIIVSVAMVWAWYRWGRPQAWIVFFPPVLFLGLGAAGEVMRLLPNLL